jgi:hypothetical protein
MIRLRASRVGAILCVSLLAACTSEAVLSRVAPPEVDKYSRDFFETMRAGSPEAATSQLSPPVLRNLASMDSVRSLRQQFVAFGVIDSSKIVNGRVFLAHGSAPSLRVLTYELWGRGAIALAEIEILEDGANRSINGLTLEPIVEPLEVTNAFRHNMGPAQLAVFLVAIGLTLFEIATAVVVARTPMPRRWLWAVFALFGVGSFAMNWTTGAVRPDLFSFQLLGSIQRVGLAGPWFISVSFPLGAIMALRKRQQALAGSPVSTTSAPGVDGPVQVDGTV